MSSVDYLILALVAISALIGVWRGFVREALSLTVWVAAFWIAFAWAGALAVHLGDAISDPGLRLALAFVLLFLAVHVAGFVVSRLLVRLVRSIGLGGVDRVAGAGFGLLRGLVVVAVLVLLAEMTPMAGEAVWRDSFSVALIKDLLAWLQQHYPLDGVAPGGDGALAGRL